MDLFDAKNEQFAPLAERMRPRSISEYLGQGHLIGEGKLLRRLIESDRLTSLIFWGPPGSGKTTLARIIAGATKSHFIFFSAIMSGIKEIREVVKEAEDTLRYQGKRTILFVVLSAAFLARCLASCTDQHIGFCTYTCLPRSIALDAITACM